MAPRKKLVPPPTVSISEPLFYTTQLLFFLLFLVILGLVYFVSLGNHMMKVSPYGYLPSFQSGGSIASTSYSSTPMASPLFPMTGRGSDVLSDPYVPPLKDDTFMNTIYPQMPLLVDVRGSIPPSLITPNGISVASRGVVPVNIPSRGYDTPYSQIGILNRVDGEGDLILPLMGKHATTSRDRYNYYTISNTGSVNTKLPIKYKGKSGVSENGCDEIMSGDLVHVDGYNGKFKTTVYDNQQFRYLPVL